MKHLMNNAHLIDPVYRFVREHGLSWSVNSTKDVLEKNLNKLPEDPELTTKAYAWMIVSQRHSRFAELWSKLSNQLVIGCPASL